MKRIVTLIVGIVSITSVVHAQKDHRANLVIALAAESMSIQPDPRTDCDTFLVVESQTADEAALTRLKNYLPLLDSLYRVNDSLFNIKVEMEYSIDSLERVKDTKTKPAQAKDKIALQMMITAQVARRDSFQLGADNAADLYKGVSYMARIFVRKLIGPIDRSRFCDNAEILLKNGDVYTRIFAIRHLPW